MDQYFKKEPSGKGSKAKKPICISLDPEEIVTAKAHAKANGVSLSALFRGLLHAYRDFVEEQAHGKQSN